MIVFVGAGPGAPDLITLRGAELLARADQVIYAGSLVNSELLRRCKAGCEIFNSAKMTLEEVLAAMQSCEAKGGLCVRLHTGDPSLYGAIREQMSALDELGIAYEICPGVSSFSAAAAALHAEYTPPAVSQSLIITRIAGRTAVPEKENIPSFAAHGASMVIFLSAGQLPELQRQLLEGGYAPETPTAIVYKASWPEEKVFRCPLSQLAATGAREGIDHFALICVGGFLGAEAERSKLYDPDFFTAFRQAGSEKKG